jgi:hypothetical protein
MVAKPPKSKPPDSREARLAKALRENLMRRKALARTRRERDADPEAPQSAATSAPRTSDTDQTP